MKEVAAIHYLCVGCGTDVTLVCAAGAVDHNVHGAINATIQYRAIHRCEK